MKPFIPQILLVRDYSGSGALAFTGHHLSRSETREYSVGRTGPRKADRLWSVQGAHQ